MDENMSRGYIQLGNSTKADRLALKRSGLLSRPPPDRWHCVVIGLLLAGIGFLLPYNSFIIAVDYFQQKYPGTTIVFDMSLIYILVAFVAVIINNLLVETLSLNVRISFGYVIAFFTLLFVAVFEIWLEVFDHDTGYFVNLLAVAVVAFGCTIQQSSFYGYTSMLPFHYTQAVMTGESAAGLLVSINRIITKILLNDERVNTILFFSISLGLIALCCVIHVLLQRSALVRFYVNMCGDAAADADVQRHIVLEPSEDAGLVDILDPVESRGGRYGVLSLRTPPSSPPGDPSLEKKKKFRVQEVVVRLRGTSYTRRMQWWTSVKRGVRHRWEVSRLIWPYMLSIALAYFVTLSLFPGIESEIIYCQYGSWMPVGIMATFNLFDFIGKLLAAISVVWRWSYLLGLSVSRIILIPLVCFCVAPRGNPILSPIFACSLTMILGLTNGLAGSLPMVIAPFAVPDHHKELTGNIMTLFYSIGLTTGSGMAYFIDFLMGPPISNPCTCHYSPMNSTDISVHWDNSTLQDFVFQNGSSILY